MGRTIADGVELVPLQDIGAGGSFGRRFFYDYSVSVSAAYHSVFNTRYSNLNRYFEAGIKAAYDSHTGLTVPVSGLNLSIKADSLPEIAVFRPEADFRVYFPLADFLSAALRVNGKYQSGQNIPDTLQFCISGMDGFRNLNGTNLTGNTAVFANAEMRFKTLEMPVFGFTTADIYLTGFSDFGRAFNSPSEFTADNWNAAFGCGVWIVFGAPVFVPFRFETSWNLQGKFSFMFSTQDPF